jgi:hypothetical protein
MVNVEDSQRQTKALTSSTQRSFLKASPTTESSELQPDIPSVNQRVMLISVNNYQQIILTLINQISSLIATSISVRGLISFANSLRCFCIANLKAF